MAARAVLGKLVRRRLPEAFELRPEQGEGVSHASLEGKSIPS